MIYNEDFHLEWPIRRNYIYRCDKCGYWEITDKYKNRLAFFNKLIGLPEEKHSGKCHKCNSLMNTKFTQEIYRPQIIDIH